MCRAAFPYQTEHLSELEKLNIRAPLVRLVFMHGYIKTERH